MAHSTSCNTSIIRALEISFIDPSMSDGDIVYINDRSLKIVTSEVSLSQEPLKKLLREKLNNAGRKSLSKRSIVEQSITYKEIKLLAHYINKPRTIQTLLNNIYQQLCASYDNLPDLVKKDMKNNNILKLPDNIHILHLIMTCHEFSVSSLALLKHLTTQCMDIDSNSPFETLVDEFGDCSQLIFSKSLSSEDSTELNNHMAYAATLYELYDICKNQSSESWNQLKLKPTILVCVHCSPTESSTHGSTITPSSGLLGSGQGAAIVEEATESLASMSDKTSDDTLSVSSLLDSKAKAIDHNPLSTDVSESLDLGQDSAVAKKTNESLTSMSDKTSGDTLQRVSTTSPRLKSDRGAKSSLASSQGARPKEVAVRPESYITLMTNTKIHDENDLSDFIIKCNHIVKNDIIERETNVKNYIADSENENKYKIAKDSLMRGLWLRDRKFDLLCEAGAVSKHRFFNKRKDMFIKNGYFFNGCPPRDCVAGISYMKSVFTSSPKVRNYIHYILEKNVAPSDALFSCSMDFWLSDPGTYIEYIMYIVIFIVLGKKSFDKHFGNIKKNSEPFSLVTMAIESANFNRLNDFVIINNERSFKRASFYAFVNHKNYEKRDFNGDFSLMYVLCENASLPTQFLSPHLHDKALESCVYEKLVNEYNKLPYNKRVMTDKGWEAVVHRSGVCSLPSLSFPFITVSDLKEECGGLSSTSLSINFNYILNIKQELKKEIKKELKSIKTEELMKIKIRSRQERKQESNQNRINHSTLTAPSAHSAPSTPST
ncbi:MAG: hypothetical protein KAG53_06405, partial [Endozoicomonadaceae bacterium]|nr:hypothetical protein [Endozoicomonadaceae bacterium]